MNLTDKRIVVLGGTSGIGLAVAQAVAREGATPVIVSSTRERVNAALATLPAGATGHALDLKDEEAVKGLFNRLGAFDHLVFTAGESLTLGRLDSLSLAAARDSFNLRYWGAFTAVKYGAPMIRPGGSVTLSSGIAGARPPQAGWALGASICAAMEGFTRAMAVELAPLRVNIVSPGFVRTPLWRDIPEGDREEMYAAAGQKLPVGRVGEAADVAEAYLFLMRQDFATGQTFVIDGGGSLV